MLARTRTDHKVQLGLDRLIASAALVALRENRAVEDEPLLNEPEAAKVLRVSTSTLKRWRLAGSGPPVAGYAGRSPRYRRSDLLAYLRRPRR
jgi:hypothetical protein